MRHLARVGLTLTLLVAFAPRDARADGAAECVAAAEQAQKLQGHGQLVEAKKKLLLCVRDTCPKVIQQDCAKWENEVETALPTVVFGVKDEEGNDITDVSVAIDGEAVIDELTGTATPIDPGSHVFIFKHASASQRVTALIREGEKDRLVTARFGVRKDERRDDGTPITPTDHGKSRPAGGYVLLVAGAAVGAVAIYGWVSGLSAVSTMRSGCRLSVGGCASSQVSAAEARLWVGDLGAPVAGIALAVGTYLLLAAPDAPAAKVGVSFGVQPGGGFLSWRRAF